MSCVTSEKRAGLFTAVDMVYASDSSGENLSQKGLHRIAEAEGPLRRQRLTSRHGREQVSNPFWYPDKQAVTQSVCRSQDCLHKSIVKLRLWASVSLGSG